MTRTIESVALFLLGLLMVSATTDRALAAPSGLSVVAGEVSASGLGSKKVTIQQATAHAVLHWREFNLAHDEVAQFIQPNSAAIALNRIFDVNPSQVFGRLEANGHVILLNPNGVLFGPTAQINVGSLTASSLHLSTDNFLSGRLHFEGQPTIGPVQNAGSLEATAGGIYLLAPNVENSGVIKAKDGQITLAAGSTVYLSNRPDGRGLLAEVKAPEGQATNLKELIAEGGGITLAGRVVNQEGLAQANSARERNGKIELIAAERVNLKTGSRTEAKGAGEGISHGGEVIVIADKASGSTTVEKGAEINVSGGPEGGHGGFVELSGRDVSNSGRITATASSGYQGGRLLIDPRRVNDFGEFQGLQDITITDQGSPDGHLEIRASADFLQDPSWTLPVGQIGRLKFLATNDVTFTNEARVGVDPLFAGLAGEFFGFGTRWDISVEAGRDINMLGGSYFSTIAGGTIALQAGRHIKLDRSALLLTIGGDIGLRALQGDIITSTFFPSGGGAFGVVLRGSGNLTMEALNGNIQGSTIDRGPGFLLTDGTATVTAGGQIGTLDAPATMYLGKGPINITAGGDLFLGPVTERGLVAPQAFDSLSSVQLTLDPTAAVHATSLNGNIHLKPRLTAGTLEEVLARYPGNFSATALSAMPDKGKIIVEQNLDFWPSLSGTIAMTARNEIKGTVPPVLIEDPTWVPPSVFFTPSFPGELPPPDPPVPFVEIPGQPPLVRLSSQNPAALQQEFGSATDVITVVKQPGVGVPAHTPGTFSLTTVAGDINSLSLDLVTPTLKKQTVITSANDVRGVDIQASVHDLGVDSSGQAIPGVLVEVARDWNMEKVGTAANALQTFGPGVTKVKVGRDLNLANSLGIVNQLGRTLTDTSDPRGVVDIGVGRNLDMTRSRIATTNGSRIFIHGLGKASVVDATGVSVQDIDGTPLLAEAMEKVVNGQRELHVRTVYSLPPGVAVPRNTAQRTFTEVGTTSMMRDGVLEQHLVVALEESVKIAGLPVVLTGQERVLTASEIKGEILLGDKPLFLEGKPVNPLLSQGKHILFGGKVVFEHGGQLVLVDAAHVSLADPVGGKVGVGTNVALLNPNLPLGIVTLRGGDIDIRSRGDVDVNLSRIGTFGSPNTPEGGDIRITSTEGSINAGSGSKKELVSFNFQEPLFDSKGNPVVDPITKVQQTIQTTAQVPSSGIFTFHIKDPDFQTLGFPEFFTPEMEAVRAEFVKLSFLGRDASAYQKQLEALVAKREPVFEKIFDDFVAPLKLGDITLRTRSTGLDVRVPPAGIRGRKVNLSAARNLTLEGGVIEGQIQVDASDIKGDTSNSFKGAFALSTSTSSSSGAATSSGTSIGGGLSGSTGGVAASSSSTASTASTATNTTASVTDAAKDTAAQQAQAQAKTTSNKPGAGKGGLAKKPIRLKSGVVIQVDVKEKKAS